MVRGVTATEAMVTVSLDATAIEHGWQLVTRDQRMLNYRADRTIAVW